MKIKQFILQFLIGILAGLTGWTLVVGWNLLHDSTPPSNAPLALMSLQKVEEIISAAEKRVHRSRQVEEQDALVQLRYHIAQENDPNILYAMAIVLYEGYEDEFRETLRDRLLFSTREMLVTRLSQLGNEAAYDYFCRLHVHYGTDAGESLKYKRMKENFPASIRDHNE